MQVFWLKVGGFCFPLEGHLWKGQGKEEKDWRFRGEGKDLNSYWGEQKDQGNSFES